MRILHLSADYPDPLRPQKTRAIANLLLLVPEHEHRVVSLNRQGGFVAPAAWLEAAEARPFTDHSGQHWAVSYRAPPKGLFHKRFLCRTADQVEELVAHAGFTPDLVHAHKLSVEGIIARPLAERLGVPLLLSVQGNTDLKIVRARPDLRRVYRQIWHAAAVVLPFAPWAGAALERLLGRRSSPVSPLPCPTSADLLLAPRPTSVNSDPVVVSAFNLSEARNKNAVRLIRAAARAAADVPGLRLEILGAGDPGPLREMAERALPGRVTFPGPVPQGEIQARFNRAAAFALVSHRESFGMVFAEALLAGTPCLYPRGRAIEGYLPEGGVVLGANPRNRSEIAAELVRLVRDEPAFKRRLQALQQSGGLDFFRRPAISQSYREALARSGAGVD